MKTMNAARGGQEQGKVSVAGRAARSFTGNALVAGYQLFAARRVALDPLSEHAVNAVVRSTRERRVELRAVPGGLEIRCGCAPTSLGEDVGCKHAWAALLEVDRQGALGSLRASAYGLHVTAHRGELVVVERRSSVEKPKESASPPGSAASGSTREKRSGRGRRAGVEAISRASRQEPDKPVGAGARDETRGQPDGAAAAASRRRMASKRAGAGGARAAERSGAERARGKARRAK